MKKVLALVMALMMSLAGLALAQADYGENVYLDGTYPIIRGETDLETMTMVISRDATSVVDINENETIVRLTEETGVVFDWQVIPDASRIEKVNLMLASGDLPDVFFNCVNYNMISQYMDQDIFLPTEDLITGYMPKLTAILDEHPEYVAEATAPDGHMYGFPWVEEMYGLVQTPGPIMINQSWLDAVGKAMPTTVDELYDVLLAFRDAGDLNGNGVDDEYAMGTSLVNDGAYQSYNLFHYFVGAFGGTDTANDLTTDHLRVEDGKVIFSANTDAWRKCVEFFNTMWTGSLIDPDAFSVHPNGAWGAYYADKLQDSVAYYGLISCWSPSNSISNIDVFEQYTALPRLSGEDGLINVRLNLSQMQEKNCGAITTDCKYPEIVAAWADYMNTPEIAVTANWGAKDVLYFENEDGLLCFNLDERGYLIPTAPWENFSEMRANTAVARGPYMIMDEYYGTVAEYTYDAVALLEFQRLNGKEDIIAEGEEYFIPMLFTTTEEQSVISQIQPTIKNLVKSYRMDFIMNGVTDEKWEAYMNELNNAGIDLLCETFQGAYDRYMEAYNAAITK